MKINFRINGKKTTVDVDPMKRLIDVIRDDLGLIGTKEGCSKGECGACSVIIDGELVTSCIYPVSQVEGKKIVTIEGIGTPEKLHPIQKSFIKAGAVQCGFCTPGMILAAKALLDKNPDPCEAEIREALSGNLCRCTGYTKIRDAVKQMRPDGKRK